jgi:hypothetical protein
MSKAFGWIAIAVMTVGITTVVVARPSQVPAPPPPVRLSGAIVTGPTDVPGLVVVPPPVRIIAEDDNDPVEGDPLAPASPAESSADSIDDSPEDSPDESDEDESDDDD